jgi:haloalkane dehalogenase
LGGTQQVAAGGAEGGAMNDVTIYDRLPQRDVEIAGFNVHLVDAGAGFPIVLVHGSPASSILFRHQIARLSHRFRVIAPDLLGFGRSAVPAGGTSFREQAEVLRGLLDHVGVERYALLGHDWGGPIAMASAIQRPEQVSQLVLVNTSLRPDFNPPWYWKPFVAPVLGEFLLVQLNLFGRGLPLMMRAARERSLRRRYLAPLSRRDTRRTVLLLERLTGYAELMREVVDVLPRMQVPALILWGEPDAYFRPHEMRSLHALIPHARVHPIPKGGHFPQEDASDAVTDALCAFLRDAG